MRMFDKRIDDLEDELPGAEGYVPAVFSSLLPTCTFDGNGAQTESSDQLPSMRRSSLLVGAVGFSALISDAACVKGDAGQVAKD